ncbi:hypothetical protein [Rhizobium mesoamericanum]|uniref:hypothetical protein n=1 Tax=Rhizobium mesoamericanum TaxID=1079800 RepID=UPI00042815F8|nr:hypothetical protein [Rhizobium mesoamericanum]
MIGALPARTSPGKGMSSTPVFAKRRGRNARAIGVADRVRAEMFWRIGWKDVLKPTVH